MPSTRITECVLVLANAWLQIESEYALAHPGKKAIITCTHRPPEEQFVLFQQGRRQIADGSWVVDEDPKTSIVTQCDGYLKLSHHNPKPSKALDFAITIAGKISWDPREYESVGVLAEKYGLIWGGRWVTLRDYPHIEVRA